MRLHERAEARVAEGDWPALRELLRGQRRAVLLADPSLAYRYGEALYHTGRMEELAGYAAEYEASARRTTDPGGTMRALNLGGIAAFELGDMRAAREKFDALLELAEAESDEDMLARAANNLGAIANLRGRRHEALAYYYLALPLYQKVDRPRGLAQTHHNLGLSFRDLGNLAESVASYNTAIVLAESISYRPLVAMSTVGRAEAELRRGDVELGRKLADRGLALARETADPISEAEALRVRGLVLAEQDAEGAGAYADLEAGLILAVDTRSALLEAEIERDLGRLEQGRGRRDEALEHLGAALQRFESLGAEAEARALRAEIDVLV
ncbi:MAG: tetratricopeptide repeat protein [Gemmatimonadota bacterium]|jgi:tetratricopeptide (TPR) repeat protein